MADKNIFGFSGPTNPDLKRAYHDKSFVNNMTARLGLAYPFMVEDAAPASTYKIKLSSAFDMMPMVFPVQSNIRQHFGVWKIPYRILWKNYKDFTSQVGSHAIPYIARSNNWCGTGSLADYMGLPTDELIEVNREVSVDIRNREYGPISPMATLGALSSDSNGTYYQLTSDSDGFTGFFGTSGASSSGVIGYGFITKRLPYLVNDGVFFLNFHHISSAIPTFANQHIFIKALARTGSNSANTVWRLFDIDRLVGSNTAVSYPYTSIQDSSFARDAQNSSVGYYGNHNSKVVCKLSSEGIRILNSLIERTEVHLFISWDASSPTLGNMSYCYTDSIFSPSILVPSEEIQPADDSGKQTVQRNYSGFIGLTHSFSYNAKIVDTADAHSNPFIIQSGESSPKCPIDAFAFRAYEFIHNFVFRQERVTPFIKGGQEVYNEFLTNDGDGADSTTPVDFFNVPFEFDMFTTCVKTPQFGNAPLVGVSYNQNNASGVMHMVPDSGDPYDIGVDLDGNANIIGVSNYSEVADKPSVARLQEAIDFGISINDFRNVSAFQRFCERFMKAGYRYEDLMYEFFGTNPPTGEEFPEFVGGMTRMVDIAKITNVAESEDAYLGKFAGTGFVAGKSKTLKFRCAEPCIIIGLTWFSVTPVYSQYLPKHFVKHDYFDWFNPQFNSIGPQPVYKYQLNPFAESNWNAPSVFGYNRPWLDYVTRVDEVHGEFRRSMKNYLIQRYFAGQPELGQDFLYIDPAQLTDVFAVTTDTDKFFGQIKVDMQVKTPVARFAIPHIVG